MNIKIKTKIRYKGQEYASPAELPAEARSAYAQAISGTPTASNSAVSKKIMLNGQEFSNENEMSAAERKLYDDAIQLMRDGPAAMHALG
jgi:hypothetical protein